ncbi:DNA polymerase III epsilon subunit [Candidatus Vidania fulgoroideae]|nr:DNA polymerase III epsilon subunit [Candidatus Vidania fulgoroideae]
MFPENFLSKPIDLQRKSFFLFKLIKTFLFMRRLLVLDTETTGLSIKRGDRIIELAIVEIVNKKITRKYFHKYFKVDKEISKESFKMHKISNFYLSKKKTFLQSYDKIKRFIGDSFIIAHNAKFDSKFIKNELKICKKKKKLVFIDTLRIFRKIFPGKKNRLKDISKRLGIKINFCLHNALNDARLLARIVVLLMNKQRKICEDIL